MDNNQILLEEIIREAPGFVGDTAKSYALSFKKALSKGTEDIYVFNKAFFATLMNREIIADIIGRKDGNKLKPLHNKGLEEIFQTYDSIGISKDAKYRLDLPTMILYAMLLESESLRKIFEKADEHFCMYALKVIHREVRKTCPYQTIMDEEEYCNSHIAMLKIFLSIYCKVEGSNINGLLAKMFKGGKTLDLAPLMNEIKTENNIVNIRIRRIQHIDKLRKEIEVSYKFLSKLNYIKDLKNGVLQISGEIVDMGLEANSIEEMSNEEYVKTYLKDEFNN